MTQGADTRLGGSTLVVRIPMRFQRRGGRKRIVAPDGTELAPSSNSQPDGTLIKAWRVHTVGSGCWRAESMGRSPSWRTPTDQPKLRLPRPASDAPRARHRRTDPRRASDGRARAVPAAVPARVGDAARATLLKPVRRCQDRLPLPFSDTGRAGRDLPSMFFLNDNQLVWINRASQPIEVDGGR